MSGTGNDEVRLDDTLAKALEQMACDLESHGAIDLDAYRVIYPRHAARIAELVPTLRALHVAMASDGEKSHDAETRLPWGVLGDFRLVREVGRGGMGIVYEAEQIQLRRRVALKVLPWAGMWDERHLQRFKNEAAAAAQLDHPHIVQVYSVASERGVHYYSMRFVDGVTIADVIRAQRDSGASSDGVSAAGSFSDADTAPACAAAISTVVSHSTRRRFQRIAELGLQAAEALAHAHQAGIIHRDIKPSNLLIDTDGKLWVTDFGLAKMDDSATLTTMGFTPGTLRYMSPEQLEGSPFLDGRTDVYSLGVTLYELLTGQPAFQGSERPGVIAAIQAGRFTPIHQLDAATPRDLETIVLKAMACDADDRFGTAGAMADDLRSFVEGRPIRSRRAGLLHRAVKLSRRHAKLSALLLAAMTLLTTACIFASILIWQARNDAEAARKLAERRLADGTRQRELADALRAQTDSQRYADDVRLAWSLYQDGQFDSARDCLAHQKGTKGNELTGRFEMSFLRSQLESHWPRRTVSAQLFEAAYSKKWNVATTVSNDGVIRLWKLPQLECIAELRDHVGDVNSTAFVNGDHLLVSGGDDGILRTWDAETGTLLGREELRFGELEVSALDDSRVVGFGRKGVCFVWDVTRHEIVCQMRTPTGRHLASSVDPVSKTFLIVHDDETITRVRPFDGQKVHIDLVPDIQVLAADYSGDGKVLATVGEDGLLRVFDPTSMELLGVQLVRMQNPRFVKCAPDGMTIITMSLHGAWTYFHWNQGSRTLTEISRSPEYAVHCQMKGDFISPDQVIAVGTDGVIQVLPPTPFRIAHVPALPGETITQYDPSADGRRIVVGGTHGTIALWDLASNRVTWQTKSGGSISALRMVEGQRIAAVIDSPLREVVRWSVTTGQEVSRFATEMSHWNVAPSGETAIIFPPGDIRPAAVDMLRGSRLHGFQGIASWHPICFTPSGRHYVTAPDELDLVDAVTLQSEEIATNYKGNSWIVLAASENAGVVIVKRFGGFSSFHREGSRWTLFATPGENVDAAAISPDESRCATLTSEGTVAIWEISSGRELLRFNLPRPSQPGQIRFCNGGRRLMCAFTTGVARGITVATWDTGMK